MTYTVSSLSTGNNYRFKVLAVNGVGDGPLSDESDLIIAANLPDPPTDVARVYADGTTITINWNAPADAGGTPITDYKVKWDYGSSGASWIEIAASTSNTLLYT